MTRATDEIDDNEEEEESEEEEGGLFNLKRSDVTVVSRLFLVQSQEGETGEIR